MLVAACATTAVPPTTLPGTIPTTTALAPTTSSTTTTPATITSVTTTTTTTTTTLAPLRGLTLESVASGLAQPTVVTSPVDDERLFVVERTGVIRVVRRGEGLAEQPFLDLSDEVTSGGIEQGMLGLAFHPRFASNGLFYVYYVDAAGQRTLTEFRGPDGVADPASGRVLFSLPQPPDSVDIRHYGGMLMFGPDGYLYVSLGDGADARGQGQDPGTVFGAILRLDVDSGDPYGIPADNPFAEGEGAPEVWAYGLRNPWRFSIDPVDSLVYVADVGQETWEEVNVIPFEDGGANLGWPDSEGNHCFLDSECDLAAFTTPVLEYGHDDGCSITGGHVYRGAAVPELTGHYFYGDWCGGWVRSFRYEEDIVTDEMDWSEDLAGVGQPNAFGLDQAGELYVASYAGDVFKIAPVR